VVAGSFAGIIPGRGTALAVRPDAVRLDADGDHEASVIISAFRGPEWVVTVEMGGMRLTTTSPTALRPGSRVRLSVDPDRVARVKA